jgi:hypothetical protein
VEKITYYTLFFLPELSHITKNNVIARSGTAIIMRYLINKADAIANRICNEPINKKVISR